MNNRPFFARPASGITGPSQWRPARLAGQDARRNWVVIIAVAGIALSAGYILERLSERKSKR